MSDGGKGSAPRKQQDHDAYASGWDRIFGKIKNGRQNSNIQDEMRKQRPLHSSEEESRSLGNSKY